MTACDWGWSVEDVANRLMEEIPKARENGPAYARLTKKSLRCDIQRGIRNYRCQLRTRLELNATW